MFRRSANVANGGEDSDGTCAGSHHTSGDVGGLWSCGGDGVGMAPYSCSSDVDMIDGGCDGCCCVCEVCSCCGDILHPGKRFTLPRWSGGVKIWGLLLLFLKYNIGNNDFTGL